MTDGNQELILEIIDIFVSQAEEFWVEMQDLLDKKDYDSLGKLAHKAKSSVAIMGMDECSKNLKNLEKNCKEVKNIESYQIIIDNFKSDCLIVFNDLMEYKRTSLQK